MKALRSRRASLRRWNVTKGAGMRRENDPSADPKTLASGVERRAFLRLAAAAAAAGGAGWLPRGAWGQQAAAVAADAGAAVRFPEKVRLITLTDYPPNLETPLKYFR